MGGGEKVVKKLMVFTLVLAASTAQAAFEFSPIISNLSPSGAGASAAFTVANSGDTKIPIQVTIVPREPDENGKGPARGGRDGATGARGITCHDPHE